MNTEIQDSLKQQVLALERSKIRHKDSEQKLDSLCESLTETTSVASTDVAAVLRNLKEEQSAGPGRQFSFSVPTINPVYTRIAVYLIVGLLTYSGYKYSQIIEIDHESQYNYRTTNFKVKFSTDVGMFKGLLGDAQRYYYDKHGDFASTGKNLNQDYTSTTQALKSFSFVDDYNILSDGSIKIDLTDSFGYNRWLKLSPKIVTGTLSDQVIFECTSNAQRNLLRFDHGAWCTHIE